MPSDHWPIQRPRPPWLARARLGWWRFRHAIARMVAPRVLLAAIYALGVIGGIGMVVYSPLILHHAIGGALTDGIGWFLAGSSSLCLATQVGRTEQWRVERSGVWLMGTAVASYAGIAWVLVITDWPGRLVEAGLTSISALFLARHLQTLNRFDGRTRRSARADQHDENGSARDEH